MTAHVRSLNVLRENVHAELDLIAAAVARIREQLDADCREVRADVEAVIDGGEF